ncbi:VOC family protein [Histidinibacterium lentulum]|uniref:Glyoxalase n=1 Tax=Histidinibacterium lentulum TaxID=2480588 RepID=A0A3N2R9N2_9RHOB|nr:VOC family protein [Histidinibacterium lentulum]ROU04101.1 glyoxalase [Histidinibacterium lentulum]
MNTAPCIFPTLRFRESATMLDWLKAAFGFSEHAVFRDGDSIAHAELRLGRSIIMIGQSKDDDYGRLVGSPESRRTDAIYVAVSDADAACARAEAAGADIVQPLRDTGHGREFTCRDPEGNLWAFGTYWPVVAPEEDGSQA